LAAQLAQSFRAKTKIALLMLRREPLIAL